MSTKANIIIRNESLRREVVLYKHSDAHPNNTTLMLSEMLRSAYTEFKEFGDIDWFLSPSKLSSFLIVRSIPKMSEDLKKIMKSMPESMKYQLDSSYFLEMPTLYAESGRVSNCNYEYLISTSEDIENNFFGYSIEIKKLSSNRIVSTVLSHTENFLRTEVKRIRKEVPINVSTAKEN